MAFWKGEITVKLLSAAQAAVTMRKKGVLFVVAAIMTAVCCCSVRAMDRPQLGAQIWIEPGQTPAQIDGWFRELSEEKMPVARLFLMWSYLEPAPGHWDFSLYDEAFQAAEKYHVRIVATLTPNGPPPFLGGNGTQGVGVIPTEGGRKAASAYIARVVQRYRTSPALDTWLLVNEPGQTPTMDAAALVAFRPWLARKYGTIAKLNDAWGTSYSGFDRVMPPHSGEAWNRNPLLDWGTFWEKYQTAQLRWLAEQVRRTDSVHPLHVNPAGLLNNLAGVSDDLPAWRSFLSTLGCSIHPAWHFGLLQRDQYALGVSYINDLIRGAIEPKPYWVTELQGGNNIYSGLKPMNPTAADIAQWVWTSVGAGADRVIFWLLNARRAGVEAGEWSLLDFEQHPSARLTTASQIAHIIDAHQNFFAGSRPALPPVTVILSLRSMTFEEAFHDPDDPARERDAHILSALGFYEALSEIGPPPRLKYFDDYDWTRRTPTPRIAILPDVRELTTQQIHSLSAFVANGNTLFISGLTGFYGPHALAWPLAGYPLAKVTGGDLKEVELIGTVPLIQLSHPPGTTLPSRFWISTIIPRSAVPIAEASGQVTATERDLPGGGKVIWIPSPVGLGAWLTNPKPLAGYLQSSLSGEMATEPFRFPQPQKACLLRVLENQGKYVSVVTNGGAASVECVLAGASRLDPDVLWGPPPQRSGANSTFTLAARGTSVVEWSRPVRGEAPQPGH